MVLCNHIGEKFANELVVAHGVDLEGKTEIIIRRLEDILSPSESSIVYKDGRISNRGFDFGARRANGIWIRQIAVEIVDIRWCYTAKS